MRLENQKKGRVIDHTWVPSALNPISSEANTIDGRFRLTDDEMKLLRSGAKLPEILFWRLFGDKVMNNPFVKKRR